MKAKRYMTIMAGVAAMLLASCVKDDLYDTPHPDHGKVAVTADWTDRGEGIAVPEKWTVGIGGYTGEETGTVHAPDHLFEPGDYTLTAYNRAEGITVSGTTATVVSTTVTSTTDDWDIEWRFVNSTPGWFFTSVQGIAIGRDRDHTFTAEMRQQVRELTLVIEPTGDAPDRITDIVGYLSGVAGSMDFATDTYTDASDMELHFTPITDGADAGKWTVTVRLLGIAGDKQTLTGIISFADGNPRAVVFGSDLTASLAGFNEDKKTPLTLGGTMAETPTETGVSGDITGWEQVDGGDVDAE